MDPQPAPSVIYNEQPNSNKKVRTLLMVVGFLLIVALGLVFYLFRDRLPFKSHPSGVIATVGKENIYQSDYDYELNGYPNKSEKDLKQKLLKKIAQDSAILQGGQDDGLVKLDSTTFNDPKKDYQKRLLQVADIQIQEQSRSNHIDGGVVSVFFINNLDNKPGPLGYEGSKKLALDKISAVYNKVKNHEISVLQAGETIRNDTSLAQIDYSYKVNAYFPFSSNPGQQITLIKELDQALFKLRAGETSDIFIGKVKDNTGKDVEGVYMFGSVVNKTPNAKVDSLDKWIEQVTKKYALNTY